MGVYIKGLQMPKSETPTIIWLCRDGKAIIYDGDALSGVSGVKEAFAVPDHGDLIERDTFAKGLGIPTDFDCDKCGWHKETPFPYCCAELDDACFALENAEVVIPAERE